MSINDLTLLYYSAHTLPEDCERALRGELLETVKDLYPIISVTQKPINFGQNICVGEIGQSHYNCYKQIYTGVQQVKTKYVAMIEDDTLYNPEHFSYRPTEDDVFSFNTSMWFLEDHIFWHKYQTGMFACISTAEILRSTMEERFLKYPVEPLPVRSQRHSWQEPGRDERLGFQNRKAEYFSTDIPLITLNYYNGLDGKKKSQSNPPVVADKLDYWGTPDSLRKKIWNHQ